MLHIDTLSAAGLVPSTPRYLEPFFPRCDLLERHHSSFPVDELRRVISVGQDCLPRLLVPMALDVLRRTPPHFSLSVVHSASCRRRKNDEAETRAFMLDSPPPLARWQTIVGALRRASPSCVAFAVPSFRWCSVSLCIHLVASVRRPLMPFDSVIPSTTPVHHSMPDPPLRRLSTLPIRAPRHSHTPSPPHRHTSLGRSPDIHLLRPLAKDLGPDTDGRRALDDRLFVV